MKTTDPPQSRIAVKTKSALPLRINGQPGGWPTTEELRERLEARIKELIGESRFALVPSPTSSGKSHNGASTFWRTSGLTDDKPVVHLHATTDSRGEAMDMSDEAGVSATDLLGREQACDMLGGDYHGEVDTPTDEPVSVWIEDQVSNRGNTLSQAHSYLKEYNDGDLPCSPCDSVEQWEDVPYDDDGEVTYDVIHATHNFAYVPTLVNQANIFIDEQPDFKSSIGDHRNDEMTRSRFQDIVTAWLKVTSAPVTSWEMFVAMASSSEHESLKEALEDPPSVDKEWFITGENAHSLAPALTMAAYDAISSEPDDNGRRVGETTSNLKRFDDESEETGDKRFNRTRITLIVDDDNKPTVYWNVPELGNARSIICLDAWPSIHEWKQNVGEALDIKPIVTPDEFEKWRRHERGLEVVQVGEGDRPAATEFAVKNYTDPSRQEIAIESIRNEYGTSFQSAIYPKKMGDQIQELLPDDVGVMTHGNVKSNNDFQTEQVGLVTNSIDPGDDYVLDLLAARGLNATPEVFECLGCDDSDPDCLVCGGSDNRKPGRKFVGLDSEEAADMLAGVRENSIAQAIGRWSRGPNAPNAVVFVRTAAIPDGMVDIKIDSSWVFSDNQKAVVDHLRDNAGSTVNEIVEATGVSNSSVRRTLNKIDDHGLAKCGKLNGVNRYMLTEEVPENGHLNLSTL